MPEARRPALSDVLAAAATLGFIAAVDYDDGFPVFDVVPIVPLLWRRRFPFAVFLATAAIALAQWALDVRAAGAVCVLVALCAVGAAPGHPWRIATATAISELGVLLVALRWSPHGGALTSFLLLSGTVTAAAVLGVYLRTRRAYVQGVLDRADSAALIATMAERARLSAEMHDIVAHSLSVMIALSDGAAVAVTRAPDDAVTSLHQASALGRQALTELRRLLDDGGEHAAPMELDTLVERVRAAGLPVRFTVLGKPPPLSPAAELTLFRLIQEALTNVLKHAPSATLAQVTLRFTGTTVALAVVNDGQGLSGMRDRAASLGGTLSAGPQPDGTWRVTAVLNLAP